MIRSLLVIVCGVFGLVLTCPLLDRLLPEGLPGLERAKLSYLAAHGDEYDVLFVGSSRIANHIMPAIFDRTAAEDGMAVKSFNAGIPGMFDPQDSYFLDLLLAAKPARVRWIVLELQPLQTGLPTTNRDTLEYVYWHDWTRFSMLCRRLAGTRKWRHWQDRAQELANLLPELGGHAVLFARRFTNVGRAVVPLQRWIAHEPKPAPDWSALGENHDGWRLPKEREIRDPKKIAPLEEELAKRRRTPPVRSDRDPATQHVYDVMVAKIRRAGITPVLLVPPFAGSATYFYPAPQLADQIIILDFCDTIRYPELYELQNRVDTSHLNPAGSEIFTRLVAQRFAEAVDHPANEARK